MMTVQLSRMVGTYYPPFVGRTGSDHTLYPNTTLNLLYPVDHYDNLTVDRGLEGEVAEQPG